MINKNKADVGAVDTSDALYKGTLRVVTEADIIADPRLVAASVVVGQLYDFSNLPYVKDGALQHDVNKANDVKDLAEENRLKGNGVVNSPTQFTSEAERRQAGTLTDEEVANQKDIDEAAQKRIDEKL